MKTSLMNAGVCLLENITVAGGKRLSSRFARVGAAVLLAATALVVPQTAAHAAPVSVTVNGIAFTADDSDIPAGASVVGYTPGSLDVVIPSTVTIGANTYNVTRINDGAFLGAPNLSSVTIPGTVDYIDQNAFNMPAGSTVHFLGMTAPILGGPECAFGYQGTTLQMWHPQGATGYNGIEYVTCHYTVNVTRTPGHTVTFDSDGGSAVPSESVNDGETATKPAGPTKNGFTFDGWYIQDSAGNLVPFDFSTPVTGAITLIAKWNAVLAPSKSDAKDKDNAPGQAALARTGAGSRLMLLGAGGVLLLLGAAGCTVVKRRQRSKA